MINVALVISAILSAAGLYMLGHIAGNMVFVGALVFGLGVCYFWPTMLGFVAENLPKPFDHRIYP